MMKQEQQRRRRVQEAEELTRGEKRELIDALRQRREIPTKFAYIGKGAALWLVSARKANSPEAESQEVGRRLIEDNTQHLFQYLNGESMVSVIELGPGDARAGYPIIGHLHASGRLERYVPIDISRGLLGVSAENVRLAFSAKVEPYRADFDTEEVGRVIGRFHGEKLVMFLGSTLSNQADMNLLLTRIRESMGKDDHILVTNGLNDMGSLAERRKDYEFKLAFDFFFSTLSPYASQKDFRYEVKANTNTNAVEGYLISKRDTQVRIGEEVVGVSKGEQIRVFRSNELSDWKLIKLMSESGYRTEFFTTSEHGDWGLVMARRASA